MTSRTERWRAAVRPGSPPPNHARHAYLHTDPPPLITPDCSISNVGVSPTHRARRFSAGSPQRPSIQTHDHQYPRHRSPPPQYHSSHYHHPSPRTPSPYSSSTRKPVPPIYTTSHNDHPQARMRSDPHSVRESRSRQDARPGLYVIHTRNGPNAPVQAVYPQRSDSAPPPRTSHYNVHRSHYSSASEKSLFRRVLDKFGNKDKENLHTRTRSSSAYPSNKHLVQSSSINRPRRNSTGSSDQWHIVPGEPQYAFTSRTSRKGTVYQII